MRIRSVILAVTSWLGGLGLALGATVLNDDGAWSWFQDERAIVDGGKLIVGSVANGTHDPGRRGHIELSVHDFVQGGTTRVLLHANLEADDHDSPALVVRPDGRILAAYSKHGPESRVYYRISLRPHDATEWQPEKVFEPSRKSRVTYSNLHWLGEENGGRGRLYNFYRGYDNSFKPSWMYSDDQGETWQHGGILIDVPAKVRHRPYVKYASDGRGAIHFAFTEGHPRDFDNSIYHAAYDAGEIHRSDGKPVTRLGLGPFQPSLATRVFAGDNNNVAWIHDLHLDAQGLPRLVYSVQKDSAGLPPRQGGQDHRYRFARWNGRAWQDFEIAYAGMRLYAGEDDYTGGVCLDPDRDDVLYISSNVDPATGKALRSAHYELFRGVTDDAGASWQWTPLTPNADQDNLRPIVPKRGKDRTALLWLRGTYRRYTQYHLEVVALPLSP